MLCYLTPALKIKRQCLGLDLLQSNEQRVLYHPKINEIAVRDKKNVREWAATSDGRN